MTRQTRLELIRNLEHERQSNVLVYVTNTRPGFSVPMAMDVVRPFYDHLEALTRDSAKVPIDLLIHSDGGEGTVPWRLVTLIREYASNFSVLVPHRAFSAATLTALGADEIVMHRMGMLGPIDPTVTNPFNPADPSNPSQKIGISVEDVTAYLALVKDDTGIRHEDELVQAFNILASHVHPLALGNVKRSQLQSRMMARKLLQLHMDKVSEEHRMNEMAENLTSKLYFHGHPINRVEAKNELDLKVVNPERTVETLMWQLYLEYEREMELARPFNYFEEFLARVPNPPVLDPTQMSGQVIGQNLATATLEPQRLVFIESRAIADVRVGQFEVHGYRLPNGAISAQLIGRSEAWERESEREGERPEG